MEVQTLHNTVESLINRTSDTANSVGMDYSNYSDTAGCQPRDKEKLYQ